MMTLTPAGQQLPVRPDGANYPIVLALHDGSAIAADTIGEAIGALLPGYTEHPDTAEGHDAALEHRTEALISLGSFVSGSRLAQALAGGDSSGLTEDRVNIYLTPLTEPLMQPWDGEPQMLRLATHYVPYTEIPPPSGNIVFLDPSSEIAFLTSLSEAGVLEVLISA